MIYTVTLNPALDRELLVPSLEDQEMLRASEVRVDYGGKGFNVSRMLAALGAPSVALGFVGGFTGAALRAGLEGLGIATDLTPIAGETRTNVSIVSADQGRVIKVNEPGPPVSAEEIGALLGRVRALARPGDWWVLAGSLPPGAPPAIYAEIIAAAQAAGGRAVLDTSGAALRSGLAARPFLVKPNGEEAAALTGLPVGDRAQARVAAAAISGPEWVAISLGADGALISGAGGYWHASSPPVRLANPVGAGDALVAGLVWRLSLGDPPGEALRWGVACGAAAAASPGTGQGSPAQVADLAGRVALEPQALHH
ncbi:1-phosphofructokinase [Oscillochloris sp. ZM17-4]|uniref:1-phosphofructokinase n=1 Tax=Oscillochloris sp. ZM17-4 TaxID=2866714 RepID=UPI001C72F057|nr:1-phosphofructokinase [Oscillochloris sp. ZM17-4]MBX0330972.1 1-phosphofructokinase [Oscillochloris sp. ZM17-4]